MTDQNVSPEEFVAQTRDSLQDVITIVDRLEPYCQTVSELSEMLTLALENDGQMRLLLDKIVKKPKK